jgi:FAD/FMN-containing dehydrogenase
VRLRAGTLLGLANRLLQRHSFRLGPDPASKDIATIGGVIANNSGGMRCGVTWARSPCSRRRARRMLRSFCCSSDSPERSVE